MKITGVTLTPVRTRRRTGSIPCIWSSSSRPTRVSPVWARFPISIATGCTCPTWTRSSRTGVVGARPDPFQQAHLHKDLFGYMPTYLRYANTYPPFQLASQIAAGVEMAFYDLAGKALGTPVYNLLGGKVRDELEITYPIFQAKNLEDVPRYMEMIQELVDRGVTRFRYYVGVDLDADGGVPGRVCATGSASGIHLKGLDFQGHLYWKDALNAYRALPAVRVRSGRKRQLGRGLRGHGRSAATCRRRRMEHIASYAQAMRMIKAGAVDIFNITHQSGGMWGAARLFALADAAGLKCLISTTQEMSIGTAAVAHLGATVPDLHYPGDPVGPLLYLEDVVVERIRYEGTSLIVPDGPGLGVVLDPARLETPRIVGRMGSAGPRRRVPQPLMPNMDHTLWVYPWDVLDDPAAADEIAALGLGRVSLAASYHTTRTLLPHNPRRKVLVARHAAVYFEPDPAAYDGLRLRPSTPDWVAPDSFGTALASLRGRGQSVNAWIVVLHNTRLGEANPDLIIENAFGDRTPTHCAQPRRRYALTPAR